MGFANLRFHGDTNAPCKAIIAPFKRLHMTIASSLVSGLDAVLAAASYQVEGALGSTPRIHVHVAWIQ
jgi:hypothetical protein